MKQTISSILKEVLENVNPLEENLEMIESSLKEFLAKFEKSLKKLKINADIFVGGSYAKNTMIRKNNYDIDIFVRFVEDRDISKLTEKALLPKLSIYYRRKYGVISCTTLSTK